MEFLFVLFAMYVVASPCLCARITPDTISPSFNVLDYGATGNGQNDESQAFVSAWKDACSATHDSPTLLIPKGKTFMLQPVSFWGPCNSASVYIKLEGTIIAPKKVEDWKWPNNMEPNAWVGFLEISGLVIYGGGQIDGQGAAWWNSSSKTEFDTPTVTTLTCGPLGPVLKKLSTTGVVILKQKLTALHFVMPEMALHFHNCENLILRGLTHINSPRNHISLNACHGSRISELHIIAPDESPNTDGIDIAESSNVIIENSKMETGDDCIAINHGSNSISIIGIFCGPGHGISVGSLGRNGAHETVEEIYVRNCTFNGTTNGARIKTWMGGHGYAKKITFEDIIVVEANNPMIIDQEYNPYDSVSAVEVSDVTFRNIRGTSVSKHAIQLHCDKATSCTNIVLEGINITSSIGEEIYASCKNAKGVCSSCIPYVQCLSEE